jgi:DNA-binding XRE family transcriptional regulator
MRTLQYSFKFNVDPCSIKALNDSQKKRIKRICIKKNNHIEKLEQLYFDFNLETLKISYLAFLRNKAKLSQQNLAKILGVCRVTIYHYENSKCDDIPDEKLKKIASFFGEKIMKFKINNGLIEIPKETFDKISHTKTGCNRNQRHNPQFKKRLAINENTSVSVSMSYANLLSARWTKKECNHA